MKILLTNYRYFISGGPERYLFNVQKQLEAHGHKVIPFSIDYAKNRPTPYSNYFVSPIGSWDQIYFDQHRKSSSTVWKTVSRLFYSREVEKAVCTIVDKEQPHVAYILHYLRKLSPSLLVGLKKKGVPIVVRLSDYAMLCPQAHCLRDGKSCKVCVHGSLFPSVRYRCLKGSLPTSLINMAATWYHRNRKFFDLIDRFVCTNKFMYRMMLEAGYPKNKLECIPTFTAMDIFTPVNSYGKSSYIIYSGRITRLKGVHVLIQAFAMLQKKRKSSIRLIIAGNADPDYLGECQKLVELNNLSERIDFVGEVTTAKLSLLLSEALFSVIPSLWFENLPNSLVESLASGTPVLASDIGSLSACIDIGRNGFLFTPGDPRDLARKMAVCLDNKVLLKRMAKNARIDCESKYSPSGHLDQLMALFQKIV